MNVNTGGLLPAEVVKMLPELEQKNYVPVERDLTKLEELKRQIDKYSPCGCGSGKKFKFCCYKGKS